MAKEKQDKSILDHINALVKEEERLYGQNQLSSDDQQKLHTLKGELDQCWDLLRQRRARRAAGLDPDKARVRDEKTVEGYTA